MNITNHDQIRSFDYFNFCLEKLGLISRNVASNIWGKAYQMFRESHDYQRYP